MKNILNNTYALRPQAPALELKQIDAGYGNAMILHQLSLCIRSGESVALLGKNGMGKSTLLKAIMGFIPKKHGSISIGGYDVTRDKAHKIARYGMAYAAQEQPLFADLSVKNNLLLTLDNPSTFDQLFARIAHLFPVFANRLDQYAGTLSGGEQKMLLVARSLMTRPDIIMLDEITEGLQPSVINNIAQALRWERKSRKTTMLIVEQNIDFALKVSDRYCILKQGQIIDHGQSLDANAKDHIYRHLMV